MYPFFKRAIDIVGAVIGLALIWPVLLVVAIAVHRKMGRPILFLQRRPGRNEQSFTCLKFRTMTDARDANGQLAADSQRLTPLGSFLRRSSLDELPQLWNVLKGDLSFIGPRPLLEQYLPYYTPQERRRHTVRPGLTGWAQIHGRNNLSFDRRLALDVWYVDHLSFALDVQILIATFGMLLRQEGIAMGANVGLVTLNDERSRYDVRSLPATKE